MTVAVILLSIYALVITAMAVTYYQAWRDVLEAIDAAYDFGHLDALLELSDDD